jgi:uncharacterized protein with PQ loop repeat
MENLIPLESTWKTIGMVAGVSMPLFNIPLIVRIVRRKTSKDISLSWVIGVWVCMVLMMPSSLVSKDMVLKSFSISNVFFFSIVVLVVVIYHNRD